MSTEIEQIAINWVCPLNNKPTTPYEIGEVRRLVRFAEVVIVELGYIKMPPNSAILGGDRNEHNNISHCSFQYTDYY